MDNNKIDSKTCCRWTDALNKKNLIKELTVILNGKIASILFLTMSVLCGAENTEIIIGRTKVVILNSENGYKNIMSSNFINNLANTENQVKI
ncbi:MAG: hypothetical protein H8E57_06445 [Candidatus Cloacimonetes bacterium]|nr:hypothetical protein [Candidatus Cloacimonadota bacterium]